GCWLWGWGGGRGGHVVGAHAAFLSWVTPSHPRFGGGLAPGKHPGRSLVASIAGPDRGCTLLAVSVHGVVAPGDWCREAADEPGSPSTPDAPRTPSRVCGARPALGRRARRAEPCLGPARGGGGGQERPVGLRVRPGRRLAGRQSGRGGVGDGTGLCRPAPAGVAH